MENANTLFADSVAAQAEPTIRIRKEKLEAARAIMEKLQDRALTYGQMITWEEKHYTRKETRVRWDGERVTVDTPYVAIYVAGAAPRIGNYTFLAALERHKTGTIVKQIKDVDLGESVLHWDGRCDHCGKPRARVNGYVIEDGSNRKIVGKSCLRDYMGMDVPEKLLWVLNKVAELGGMGDEDEDFMGGGRSWTRSTWGVLAASYAAISLFGYAKKDAGHRSTAARVSHYLSGATDREDDQKRLRGEMNERAEFYMDHALKIIEWATTIKTRDQYLHNIKVLIEDGFVADKNLGIMVSAPLGYIKECQRLERIAKANPDSKHVGELKKRMTVNAAIERIISIDNMYGQYRIFIFRTDDGSLLRWKTGLDTDARLGDRPVIIGDKVKLTCTPTFHGSYEGENQTYVNRCKMEVI